MNRIFVFLAAIASVVSDAQQQQQPEGGVTADYGVDCSFPIHRNTEWTCGDLLGDKKAFYEDFMQGCRDYYGKKGGACDRTEADRLEMSLYQPQSMVVRFRSCCVRVDS